jgi:hypothetical protein
MLFLIVIVEDLADLLDMLLIEPMKQEVLLISLSVLEDIIRKSLSKVSVFM